MTTTLSWFDESLVIVASAAKVAAGSANRDDASASFILCCFVLFDVPIILGTVGFVSVLLAESFTRREWARQKWTSG